MLDKTFPASLKAELDARADDVANRAEGWNYKKRAYCSVTTTGKNATALCSKSGVSVGDGNAPTGGHSSMYTAESSVRKLKPILTSVKLINQGGSDYTEAYIYEAEFDMKVYTLADLDKMEEAFMRVGTEVEIKFGWLFIGRNNEHNQNSLKVNVSNYSFSMEEDGGFKISIKAISPAALWSKDTPKTVEDPDSDAKFGYPELLMAIMLKAAGKDVPAKKDLKGAMDELVDGKSANNQLIKIVSKDNYYYGGLSMKNVAFYGAELIAEHGIMNDTEDFRAYCTLNTMVGVANALLKKQKATTKFIFNAEACKFKDLDFVTSADPGTFVLSHQRAKYGPGGDNFDWRSKAGGDGVGFPNDIRGTLINLQYISKIFDEIKSGSNRKNGVKMPVTFQAIFKKIFDDIGLMTGGHVNPTMYNYVENQNDPKTPTPDDPTQIWMVNSATLLGTSPPIIDPYKFTTLSDRSITKSVSMDTDFNSDTIMMASTANISSNNSNHSTLLKLYPNCEGLKEAKEKGAEEPEDDPKNLEMKLEEYADAYTTTQVSTIQDMMREIVFKNINAGSGTMTPQQYEVQYPLKLNVTIDGIFGLPFLAPITVDRMPAVYRNNKSCFFSVIGQEHTWDCQGGWETSYDTVMRIQGKGE